jgi:hypothetical protein
MDPTTLIDNYLAGPQVLRRAVIRMSQEQLLARPIAGKWSTLEVICHLTDFEIVGADRIKRVIAENEPTLFGSDEKVPLLYPLTFTVRVEPHRNPTCFPPLLTGETISFSRHWEVCHVRSPRFLRLPLHHGYCCRVLGGRCSR